MDRVAEQQLSRMAELLLGDEGVESFKAICDTIAGSRALRLKVARVIRDHCALTMRPEIKKFAGLMEMKLRKHDPSMGSMWKDGTPLVYLNHMLRIMNELEMAVDSEKKIGLKAADVANYAMILSDIAGELEDA